MWRPNSPAQAPSELLPEPVGGNEAQLGPSPPPGGMGRSPGCHQPGAGAEGAPGLALGLLQLSLLLMLQFGDDFFLL